MKNNLVIDLDETLIHTVGASPQFNPELAKSSDFNFQIKGNWYYVLKRPGVDLFLDFAIRHFRVGIWTAAQKDYAIQVCKNIFTYPQVCQVSFIYSRNFCHIDKTISTITKPLQKIYKVHPEFHHENTLMIDNTAHVMMFNKENAIHVPDFTTDQSDTILYHLRNIIIKYYQHFPQTSSVKHLAQIINHNLTLIQTPN